MTTMLIVEDDPRLCAMLQSYFEEQEFTVASVGNGTDAATRIVEEQPEIVLLDLMLPGLDGLGVCRQVRERYSGRILMLTASDDDFDQVAALETGVDDFVTKPIKPRVLLARVRMLLRRGRGLDGDLVFGGLKLSRTQHSCHLDEVQISLTDSEFDLLWLLASSGETLSRDFLTEEVRGIPWDGLDRTIDNKIVALRKKLNDSTAPPSRILTVRGKGYRFVADAWGPM